MKIKESLSTFSDLVQIATDTLSMYMYMYKLIFALVAVLRHYNMF